jgi:hypothetical protein
MLVPNIWCFIHSIIRRVNLVKHSYRFETFLLDHSLVINMLEKAIGQKRSFSLGRFGIGEISFLSWPAYPLLLENFKRYESYAGITCAPEIIKRELVTALKTVDTAGLIPSWKLDDWSMHTHRVLEQLKIMPRSICCAWIMHDMVRKGSLWPFLNNKKVILVGRRSMEAVPIFKKKGVFVTGSVPFDGYSELDDVSQSVLNDLEWEIALISAGIPATILAPRIAKESGRIAIDFGHALDIILDGDGFNHSALVEKWNGNEKA